MSDKLIHDMYETGYRAGLEAAASECEARAFRRGLGLEPHDFRDTLTVAVSEACNCADAIRAVLAAAPVDTVSDNKS